MAETKETKTTKKVVKTKNIYQKLQECRVKLQNMELNKTGNNKFAGYKYFELADFLPSINELFNDCGLFGNFSILGDVAQLQIVDVDNPEMYVTFTSNTAEAKLKGCHPVQNLGAVHTYLKRYLYINALEIVENDILDSTHNNVEQPKKPTNNKKKPTTTSTGLASDSQLKTMVKLIKSSDKLLNNILKNFNVTTLNELTKQQASETIQKLTAPKGNQ